MGKTQKVSQKKWIKGVNAAATSFAQPAGSYPRGSNALYTRRGGLVTCDGTQLISSFNGAPQTSDQNIGPITEIFLYQPVGLPNAYYGITKDFNTHLAVPTGVAVVDGGTGGNLSAGLYSFVVTALDGAGGETTQSTGLVQITFGGSGHKANLSWTAVPLAAGYNVYAETPLVPGVFGLVNSSPILTNSYVDNVADVDVNTSINPPTANDTQVSQFYNFTAPSYTVANIVKTLPADPVNIDGTPGGGGGGRPIPPGGGGGGGQGSGGQSPQGGVPNVISAIPQIVQFNNLMILALGNGLVPYSSDGTGANTIQLINTFVATYPARQNSIPQITGDMITVNVGGTNYLFKCVQGGTTASSSPTFSATLNQTVADGSVIWQNIGVVATSQPPRGAAHAIVYAGSLWVANTSPTTTTDNQDGPSCLKMSDLNNPNSWNPLNLAFLDRDDGTQITGLATFTIAEAGIPPTGSLVVFKDFSTFQVNGVFGSSSFSIQRAQTDLGCSASRTIQFIPGFGIGRMTHLGIAIFDGVRDRLISEEIRPYIFGDLPDIPHVDWNFIWFSKAALTANPPMYVCACPILPQFDGTLVDQLGATSIAGNLPFGTYSVQAILYKTDGTIFETTLETMVAPGNGFQITFPAVEGGLFWQLFFGIGTPNQYVYVTYGGVSTFNVTNPGLPGFITSSNGQLRRLFCYDLVLKSWAIVDLPFPISVIKQFRTIGSIPITVMGGFFDGSTRRWQMGDTAWDAGAITDGQSETIQVSIRTPNVFGKEASDRTYFRELAVRGVGDPSSLKGRVTTNGLSGQTLKTENFNSQIFANGEFSAYLDIAISAVDAYADISWQGPLEIDSIDWSAVAKAITGKAVAV